MNNPSVAANAGIPGDCIFMQLMCDALAVLGSRHGLIFDPIGRECRLVRFDTFEQAPRFALRAGVRLDGGARLFPLCATASDFDLVDQRTAPSTVRWIGLAGELGLKVVLSATVPFRPRDLDFSAIPIVHLSLSVEKLPGQFRWSKRVPIPESVELFLEIGDGDLQVSAGGAADELEVEFTSWLRPERDAQFPRRTFDARSQRDTLVAPGADRTGRGFRRSVALDAPVALDVFWCAWPGEGLTIDGVACAFWHARQFDSQAAVVAWARNHGSEIRRNALRVDGLVQAHDLGPAVDHLHAFTLHSWLINTWLVQTADAPWLSIWEGSCYFHSTLDVEFTQAPFYLAVWPELLGLQLRQWAARSCAGEMSLGDRGAGTAFMPHDVGRFAEVGAAAYPHPMEVEETANYLLLVFAHWRRTGDRSIIDTHSGLLARLVGFLRAADSGGSGVPDCGVANTIDDGSPAIQYGRRQVYLALKTHAALRVAVVMLQDRLGVDELADWDSAATRILAEVEQVAWQQDHYAVLLESSGRLRNPWTGEWTDYPEIPGWDAPHIYTCNVLPILDMVGFELGLNRDRVRTDLNTSTRRCLREYGCAHTDFQTSRQATAAGGDGLTGAAREPGWISMNMLRDLAALRRGIDLRALAGRYWEWQVLTNSQGPQLFFETFGGNNLCFYPRGVAIWGLFESMSGLVIDRAAGRDDVRPPWPDLCLPRLWDAAWDAAAGAERGPHPGSVTRANL
ncbi:MAG: DUF4965 domain-containing protein [Lacunisphaera sp.]|nr:DUF4965 domain-containing protein [Lacunisphaera sp.]